MPEDGGDIPGDWVFRNLKLHSCADRVTKKYPDKFGLSKNLYYIYNVNQTP